MTKNWCAKIPKLTKTHIAILCVLVIIAIILVPDLVGLLLFFGYPLTLIVILLNGQQRQMTFIVLFSCAIVILGSLLTYQYIFVIVVYFSLFILLMILVDSIRFSKKSWHGDRVVRVCSYLLTILVFWGCSEYVSHQRRIIQNEIVQVVEKYHQEHKEYPSETWLTDQFKGYPIKIRAKYYDNEKDKARSYLAYCRYDFIKTNQCITRIYNFREKFWRMSFIAI